MSRYNIKQHDITDCGAACLASIASYYKLHLPISKIRQIIETDKLGTTVLGLVEGAEKLGFDAKGVKGDLHSLYKIPTPAIAHLTLKNKLQHFVVIYSVFKDHIRVMDPATGKLSKVPVHEFKAIWTGVLVIMLPNDSFVSRNEKVSLLLRFWHLLKPHRSTLMQSMAGSVFYTVLGFSTSIYIQKITDHVLVNENVKLLNIMSAFMVFLLFTQIILSVFKDLFLIRSGQEIDARLIMGYYKHLLKLPQRFFDTMRVGEILSRINDAVKIRIFINNTSLNLMVNFLIVLFSFMLMFTYYWKLGLLMFCVLPVYAMIFFIANRLNRKTERIIMESSAELESQLVESLSAVATIKQFGLEKYMHAKTETKFIKLLKIGYRSSLNQIFSQYSTQSVANLFTILLLWIGSYYVMANELSPGELFSFYAIIGYFTGPASSLISSNKTIQNALIAADRLFEILDLEIEEEESGHTWNSVAVNSIEFKNVFFRYHHKRNIFSDLNLIFKKGEISAIVGESGCGKSSLLHLIQRIYPLQKGAILINDSNIKYMKRSDLNKLIGVVPQKIDLFDGNVVENISIGSLSVDMRKILEVCRSLGIEDFIESLPHGFYTQLGENGATLSGGQKQKIAIARALYHDPEIIILDEASSSLDSCSDAALQKILLKMKAVDKIIILVSHRLLNLSLADKINVLSGGRLIQNGTHEQLILKKGPYQNLWNKQFPGTSPLLADPLNQNLIRTHEKFKTT